MAGKEAHTFAQFLLSKMEVKDVLEIAQAILHELGNEISYTMWVKADIINHAEGLDVWEQLTQDEQEQVVEAVQNTDIWRGLAWQGEEAYDELNYAINTEIEALGERKNKNWTF